MEFTEFEDALTNYSDRDFVIELPDGSSAIWWNANIALAHERRVELYLWLEALAAEGLLPEYQRKPGAWIAQNIRVVERLGKNLVFVPSSIPNLAPDKAAAQIRMVEIFDETAAQRPPEDNSVTAPRI